MAGHGIPRVSGLGATTGAEREKELSKIQDYRELVDTVNAKMQEKEYTNDVLDMTTKLLELNPEYYTVWNHRRRLLRSFLPAEPVTMLDGPTYLEDSHRTEKVRYYVESDLLFLFPLLRKFPKCYWIWNYRLWLLNEASRLMLPPDALHIWQKELDLVGKMLSLDSRNFHGWGYRRMVVSEVEKLSARALDMSASRTEEEFLYTTKMVESNLSNFSAWHRRSKLIPTLLEERKASDDERREFLDKELELIQRALWADPDSKDQSLWFYHQYLIRNFEPNSGTSTIVLNLTTEDKLSYIESQIDNLVDMLEGAETCKWIYQRLIELSLMARALNDDWPVESSKLKSWIDSLADLDRLRKGRWDDLRTQVQG